jgi:hypothetical protein
MKRRDLSFLRGAALQEHQLKAEQITYPPLDVPKPVTASVWIVDSGPTKAMGVIPLPIRMTIIRVQDGSLMLHSPTRYDSTLRRSLEEFGAINHIIAPNSAHWMFVKQWQEHCPSVETWGAPGLSKRWPVKRAGVRLDHELTPDVRTPWSDEISHIIVKGIGFAEVALMHERSRSLVLADLVQNLEADKLPPVLRPAARLAGVVAPHGRAPVYLRAIVKMKRNEAAAAARRLVNFKPRFVIFSHGQWYAEDATARLASALDWLLE